ncbi:ribbon-helix-helix domain-containing protein [Sulfuritalea hydrogenivorans]|jgi:hypothetical protein|uniref:Antitoxin VapB39 n=1 Tax=Sulfuritalea hydrogenivorans sk43H TaxID=1223802 RepID=W0SH47_9PROT|nr:CopG family transcriptional regulator [Sulfuritalea hydrogenivorans]BAO29048.1 hypothetical protein SUTH_01248 [Sulfuritalea hydrogenivorans sk43H]
MRTTLEIDDDVLHAAKELSRRGGTTAGRVISDLVRQALTQPAASTANGVREPAAVYGFRPFPSRGSVVTNDQVDKLRDEEGA